MRRVLLVGATGQFGQRLARHLAEIDGVELVLASRSPARAEDLAQSLVTARAGARIAGVAFERNDDPASALSRLRPWLVIDASGPFQTANYDLARAALAAGAHWIDLADSRAYLLGFSSALDALSRELGLTAAAGASSTPALSSTAVSALTPGWKRIDTIDIAIFPAGGTEVGLAVVEAVLSYAGRQVAIWNEGVPQTSLGWGRLERRRLPHFGWRRLAAVETADADILPALFKVRSRVAFYAGLESPLEQWGLWLLARLLASGWVTSLQPLAPQLERARRLTRRFAGNDGGMTVDVRGLDENGQLTFARWFLLAERGDGPQVPVLAALALTRKLLAGKAHPGAATANAFLDLTEIEREMAPFALRPTRTISASASPALFEAACGADTWKELPQAVRAFHAVDAPPVWRGRADIATGKGLGARLLQRAIGFGQSGDEVSVSVSVERTSQCETWTRNFAEQRFQSELRHEHHNVIAERFGPFTILLEIAGGTYGLTMPVRGWRLFGVPLPKRLAPRSHASEYEDEFGRFRFDVRISAPLFGPIVHYTGWLRPQEAPAAAKEEAVAVGKVAAK